MTVKEGYVSLNRTWSKGDKVRLELPMHLRAIALPDGSANYSILYGPIVLAARLGKQNQDGMFADDSRGGHIAAGPRLPLQTMPVIVGDKNNLLSHLKKVEGKPLTFTLSGVYPERYEGMTVEPFFVYTSAGIWSIGLCCPYRSCRQGRNSWQKRKRSVPHWMV